MVSVVDKSAAASGGGASHVALPGFKERFVEVFKEVVDPCYRRKVLIEDGRVVEALNMKPSGIWYASEYADALVTAGDEEVCIKGRPMKASRVYTILRNQGKFIEGNFPTKYWKLSEPSEAGLREKNFLILKEGVSASEALEAIPNQLTFFDCGQVISLATFLAAKRTLGAEQFDRLVRESGGISIGRRCYGKALGLSLGDFTHYLSRRAPLSYAELEALPLGAVCYLQNHESYKHKHFAVGLSSGFNLVALGDKKFTGLGLDPRGVSLEAVRIKLLEAFNAPQLSAKRILPDGKSKKDLEYGSVGDPSLGVLTYSRTYLESACHELRLRRRTTKFFGDPTLVMETLERVAAKVKAQEAAATMRIEGLSERETLSERALPWIPQILAKSPKKVVLSKELKG